MSPVRGITLKIASVLVFIIMASLIKFVSDSVPPGQAVFFRSLFAIPVIVGWLALRGELVRGLQTPAPMSHFWRGLAGTSAMMLGFAGLAYLPLPEVTAIGYAAPLLTVIFAAMFLGENVRVFRFSAVCVGLGGVLIVLSPRLSIDNTLNHAEALGAILVLTGAVFAALAQIFIRKMVATESTTAIVFYFSLSATCLSLITLPFGWVMPTLPQFSALMVAGVLGGIGQILLTSSYRHADASVVAPFEYASILFALVIGYWVFGEVPTRTMLIGASIIVLAGIVIILREHQLGLERARQRKVMTPQG